MNSIAPILESELICPECGCRQSATMPTNACIYFFDCAGCGTIIRPKLGDCCVFCSYGTVPCPPMQGQEPDAERACCN